MFRRLMKVILDCVRSLFSSVGEVFSGNRKKRVPTCCSVLEPAYSEREVFVFSLNQDEAEVFNDLLSDLSCNEKRAEIYRSLNELFRLKNIDLYCEDKKEKVAIKHKIKAISNGLLRNSDNTTMAEVIDIILSHSYKSAIQKSKESAVFNAA